MAIEQEMQGLGLGGEKPQGPTQEELDFNQRRDRALFSRAIPGQGLTTDPNNPQPWERPPKYTNYDKAVEFIFEDITEKASPIVRLIAQGASLEAMTEMYLSQNFGKGMWEPSLMLLLIEPTMYIIMFVCEVAGVEYEFEDESDLVPERTQMKMENNIFKQNIDKKGLEVEKKVQEMGVEGAAQDVIPPSLLAKGGM